MYDKPCPCNSGLTYAECCAKYVEGTAYPEVVTDLVRARYTAMSLGKYEFLIDSTHPQFRSEYSVERIAEGMNHVKLERLELGETRSVPSKVVDQEDFEEIYMDIYFSNNGMPNKRGELSYFSHHEGKLYYVDSAVRRPKGYRREAPKTGRNDPCTCGSGLKYKKCCANKTE